MNSVYAVEISPSAQRQMMRLPRDVRDRIIARLHALADNPRPPGVVKLKGRRRRDEYRIRVGDYRVIYQIFDDVLVVLIVRVANRRDVYRYTR